MKTSFKKKKHLHQHLKTESTLPDVASDNTLGAMVITV